MAEACREEKKEKNRVKDSGLKFNFLVPCESDAELARLSSIEIDSDWKCFAPGAYAWCLQTYLVLRNKGLTVSCSHKPVTGAVNIGHYVHLKELGPHEDMFVVCCQAEYRRMSWAQLRVVQNQDQLDDDAGWLPHWPQPGLVGRDSTRAGVKRAAHAGRQTTLAGAVEQWERALGAIGAEFMLKDESNWNDFSNIDILLAVRSFDRQKYARKPPTKLFNAWRAGVPLVAGYDSAYEQVGSPGRDYVRVESLDEAVGAIQNLREDPARYRAIVESGRKRAEEYDRERIAELWERFLEDRAGRRYEQWLRRSPCQRASWRGAVARDRIEGIMRSVARKVTGKLTKSTQAGAE